MLITLTCSPVSLPFLPPDIGDADRWPQDPIRFFCNYSPFLEPVGDLLLIYIWMEWGRMSYLSLLPLVFV